MDSFNIAIAGLSVEVHPLFETTREYCKAYLTDDQSELSVSISADDLVIQQKLLDQEAVDEGIKFRKFTDPFLERAVIQRKVADALLLRNTLMLHGSTVSVDGSAYLFTAPCKTGKSTHTRLWRELFGNRAVIVNDDMPFLRLTSSEVIACGSPWNGKHGLSANISVLLKGICFLHRGDKNVIKRADPEFVIDLLQHQAYTPADDNLQEKAHSLVCDLADRVALWEMYCTKDLDAAKIAYSAMTAVIND